jgi:hypothetical protein
MPRSLNRPLRASSFEKTSDGGRVRAFYGNGGCRYRRHVDLMRVASAGCPG